MATAGGGGVDDISGLVIDWYRARLAEPARFPWSSSGWEPVRLGPTWQAGPDGRWLLPERTLGWSLLGWCGQWLQHEKGSPWRFTLEQARWWLWWYAVDTEGRFVYRDGILQRLKGWGKDPVGACLCAVEQNGPVRFSHWGDDGEPVGREVQDAWVQTAAVSLEQTKNTMRLFPRLFTDEAKETFGLIIGKEQIHSHGAERLIQAVTSSPSPLEGARSTFVLKNETHHWLSNNDGHEMAAVIDRNATKSKDGAARTLSITNAYEPGEDSVAEREREAFDKVKTGQAVDTGISYDSLEAPPNAPLSEEAAPSVIDCVRGDSTWLDKERIVQAILDIRNPPSRSRRFWYNQITAAEDAWVSPQEWDRIADPSFVVPDGTVITLGFDGSMSDDDTALIGCVVDDDHLFELGVWFGAGGIDRADVDRKVRETIDRYDVVGFYGDVHPWESYIDRWAEEFGEGLVVKPTQKHAVGYDMRTRTKDFTHGCERMLAAIVDQEITHCGSERMRRHFHNAKRAPNGFGLSVRKEHRESARKIDSVPAAVLARLARSDYLALPESRRRRKRSGKASFL